MGSEELPREGDVEEDAELIELGVECAADLAGYLSGEVRELGEE